MSDLFSSRYCGSQADYQWWSLSRVSRVISEFVVEMVTEALITDRGLSSGGDIGLMTTKFSQ